MDVRVKRAYEPAKPADGYRVLVDRLWARGLSRVQVELDDWDKQLAPSTAELRDQRPRLAGLRRGLPNER
jgi:uncharacterized protein YeaO (DUF488 family)